jgi:hypothetical protein
MFILATAYCSKYEMEGSFVLVSLGVVVGVECLLLHLLRLQLVVLVHALTNLLQAFVFCAVLNDYGLSLRLHLLRE